MELTSDEEAMVGSARLLLRMLEAGLICFGGGAARGAGGGAGGYHGHK